MNSGVSYRFWKYKMFENYNVFWNDKKYEFFYLYVQHNIYCQYMFDLSTPLPKSFMFFKYFVNKILKLIA